MVTITEEPDQNQPVTEPSKIKARKSSSTSKPPSNTTTTATSSKTSSPSPSPSPSRSPNPNPFTFWFYFTLIVSIVTLFFVSLPSISPQDPKSWFLSLPSTLRHHYSKGRIIKVQTTSNQSPIEIFTTENGSKGTENVVLIHGMGLSSYSFRKVMESLGSKGVHVIAFDLPGNGFSDKSMIEVDDGLNGGLGLGRLWNVYSVIQEKGIFWAFDQIIETGEIPYEEIEKHIPKRKVVKPISLGPEDIGSILGQIIDTIGLAPVHLVLHDSALSMVGYWISENSRSVRSLTLIDTLSIPSFPLWLLDLPVLREVVLGSSSVYAKLINLCCSNGDGALDMEAHRILLKGRGGRKAIVSMGRKMNYTFDIAEWGSLDALKSIPMQILWSRGWSKEWSEEGRRVANVLPQATFVTHSGGRWAQEDAAESVADSIIRFVSSLPPTVRQAVEEPIPKHIHKSFDETENINDHHHHHDHNHGHGLGQGHIHGAGYMDAYGLGQAW